MPTYKVAAPRQEKPVPQASHAERSQSPSSSLARQGAAPLPPSRSYRTADVPAFRAAVSSDVPQFFAAQAFSPAVAKQAVSGARAGQFPFGDRIKQETGNRVDPHSIPSVVVPKLPGLGVCQDGKVALRQGTGIEVARHELAHALGADEAVAQQASRSSRVLAEMAPASPVNGWMIGFEFQTVGTRSNPKVFSRYSNGAIPPFTMPTVQHDAKTLLSKEGWKMAHDNFDIEVITSPVEENEEGEKKLDAMFDGIEAEMEFIQSNGVYPKFVGYNFPPDPDHTGVFDSAQIDQATTEHNEKVFKVDPPPKLLDVKPVELQNGMAPVPKPPELNDPLPMPPMINKPKPQRRDSPTIYAEYGLGVSHRSAGKFTAHPQSTVGIRFDKLAEFMHRLAQQKPTGPHIKSGDKKGQRAWGKQQVGWSTRQGTVHAALKHVDAVLSPKEKSASYQTVRGLVSLIATYLSMEQFAKRAIINIKNIAPFMLRNNMAQVYGQFSKEDKQLFEKLLRNHTIAQALGYSDNSELRKTQFFRHGVNNIKDGRDKFTIMEFLEQLTKGTDLLAALEPHSMHQLTETNYMYKLEQPKEEVYDIEKTDPNAKARRGIFVEFRKLKGGVPWDQWRGFAKALLRMSASVDQS